MIFVAVGTQLPFDRMVHAVDRWAAMAGRTDIFAQVGPTAEPPTWIQWTRSLAPREYERRVDEAEVVVAHAGMGTILTCLLKSKPVLVMPRRATLGEQRNDHQLATAGRLSAMGLVEVARDERHLTEWLERLGSISRPASIGACASEPLLAALRSFIRGVPTPAQAVEATARADVPVGVGVPGAFGTEARPHEVELKPGKSVPP